jgi:dTDP-4-amino-4,6-dideoxygalactose transaminase
MSPKVSKSLNKVLYSGYIGQGQMVEKFESKLKAWFNTDYVLTLNSGTSGLHLALHMLKTSLKLKEDDEVLTTPLTCTATNWPILANGLRIKWVDIDPYNLNMDLVDLERKITPKTKIIMIVHWGGYPIDLYKLKQIQGKTEGLHGFKPAIVEDCAHAFGSEYKNKPVGTFGNISVFSLQAIKHITAIDGGIMILSGSDMYRRAKLLRWYGLSRETGKSDFRCELDVSEWGFKFHMNDVNAVIGMKNLEHVDDIIIAHQSNADYYNNELIDVDGVTLLSSDYKSSYWLYTIHVEDRNNFIKHMKSHKIMTSMVHRRNDVHSCVRQFRSHLPNLDYVEGSYCCIPVGWWVTDEDRERIVSVIKKGW